MRKPLMAVAIVVCLIMTVVGGLVPILRGRFESSPTSPVKPLPPPSGLGGGTGGTGTGG